MSQSNRKQATASNPCPVCESGTKNCSVGEDGFILCRGKQGAVPGFVYLGQAKKDPQWGEYRREGDRNLNTFEVRIGHD